MWKKEWKQEKKEKQCSLNWENILELRVQVCEEKNKDSQEKVEKNCNSNFRRYLMREIN